MEPINPDGLVDATEIGYSQAVLAGDTLYASGQVGWDEHYDVAGEDVRSQARKAFENVEVLLADVPDRDLGLEDVAKVTGYLVRPHDHLEAYLDVFGETFPEEPYPAHTILGVEQLAQEAFLVEVEVEVPLTGE